MAALDWRDKAIPFAAIILFAFPTVVIGFHRLVNGLWWLHLIILFIPVVIVSVILSLKYRQAVIGMGDLLMLLLVALWLDSWQLPYLLILSGLMSVLFSAIGKVREIPFIPGLIISWGVLMALDGPSVKQYIRVMSDYLIGYIVAYWPSALAAK